MRNHRFTERVPALSMLTAALVVLTSCGGGSSGDSAVAPPPDLIEDNGAGHNPLSQPDPAEAPGVDLDEPSDTEITLLAVVTESVSLQYPAPRLRVEHLVNVSNDIIEASGISLKFRLVHYVTVDYPDGPATRTALEDITFGSHANLEHVAAIRDEHRADLVVLFRPYVNDGVCGYAWIGGYQTGGDFSHPAESDFGYSVVNADCSDYTLLHELGHNLGLAHSRREDPLGGSFAFGAGHGVDNGFVTIMATPGQFNAPRLPKLSTPYNTCDGAPCGVDHTDKHHGADAVRAIKRVMDQVADYR